MFGMVDTSHTPALGYMEMVHEECGYIASDNSKPCSPRDDHPLGSVAGVQPGGTTSSRLHSSHSEHSLHFVDPATGVHTQHVESYWNRVKVKLKRMKGCHLHQLPGYLDEFMWRERHGKTGKEAFSSILRDIAQQYPV